MDLLYKQEVYQIIGACMAVYNDKGHGFVEPVYQECLEIELAHQEIPFEAQQQILLHYRGVRLKQTYIPDVFCYGKIIVELKAAKQLNDEHRAQLINYLKATGIKLGLLLNFGTASGLQWERIVLSQNRPHDQ
jgi:GxxExxY protein